MQCEECGKLTFLEMEEVHVNRYSSLTGKLLKRGKTIHVNAWYHVCSCGWQSEVSKLEDNLPELIVNRKGRLNSV